MRPARVRHPLAVALLIASASAAADEGFLGHTPLDAQALSGMRGGFVSAGGLRIGLGIDRAVLINNRLVDSISIRIPDLAAIRAGSPDAVQVSGATTSIVQNGPGNFADRGLLQQSGPGLLTIIQNSLNNQLIQSRTVINIDVSGLSATTAAQAASVLDAQLHNFR